MNLLTASDLTELLEKVLLQAELLTALHLPIALWLAVGIAAGARKYWKDDDLNK